MSVDFEADTPETVTPFDPVIRLSISRLAGEFGMARHTVSKRLTEAGVTPDGMRKGYPVYRLRDACPALLTGFGFDANGNVDPKTLPPEKRNAWYQSENRRLDFEMTAGQLIPVAQFEASLADMVKDLVQFLETLPDTLERDFDLSPEQVQRMHDEIDRRRQELYERIVNKCVEPSEVADG